MKKFFQYYLLICFMIASITTFATATDSISANLIGEVTSGLYNYYIAPHLSAVLQQLIIQMLAFGIPLLALFGAQLKADPNKQALSGIVGAIVNSLSWFVENVGPVDPLKKK